MDFGLSVLLTTGSGFETGAPCRRKMDQLGPLLKLPLLQTDIQRVVIAHLRSPRRRERAVWGGISMPRRGT
jgi:hypothetical protein